MKGIIAVAACTFTVIPILISTPEGASKKESVALVEVITVEGGYGYQIVYGTKVMVRQEYIPVIPGRKPFASAREAEKTATLVKNKLVARQDPAISLAELEALQIIY